VAPPLLVILPPEVNDVEAIEDAEVVETVGNIASVVKDISFP
jgi:hypothetical protein